MTTRPRPFLVDIGLRAGKRLEVARRSSAKRTVTELATLAGITINGRDPWDIEVRDERFYDRLLNQGSLGLGESYMDAWWDAPVLDEFFFRIRRANLDAKVRRNWSYLAPLLGSKIFNLQTLSRAFQIGERHYDLGNDLYQAMLDARMVYSCAYWKEAATLDEAQEAKLELVCRKLQLQPGQRVLDIGCGFGSFAKYAVERYGVKVVGITVAREQLALGRDLCKGLPIDLRLADYRSIEGKFDRIASIGMIEHVGVRNYRTLFEVVHRALEDDGLFLLHTIGRNTSNNIALDPWILKYIFPNSEIPATQDLTIAFEDLFVMEDWHNFGADYDKTLMAWFHNFDRGWPELRDQYGERFYRMWKYYLLSCAGAFRARKSQLWHLVLSKNGIPGGYASIR